VVYTADRDRAAEVLNDAGYLVGTVIVKRPARLCRPCYITQTRRLYASIDQTWPTRSNRRTEMAKTAKIGRKAMNAVADELRELGLTPGSLLGQQRAMIEQRSLELNEPRDERQLQAWRSRANEARQRYLNEDRQRYVVAAAARLGIEGGPGSDHFECPECGRWAGVEEAANLKEVSIASLGLARKEWAIVLDRARTGPIRPSILQRDFARSYEAATAILDKAERLALLRPEGKGFVPAGPRCGPCYERRASQAASPRQTTRDAIPAQLRFRVLQRDGFRCQYCGRSARDGAILHLDHVVPYSAGGETSEDNLISACDQCNLGKSARSVMPE
jgi:HNH endonuclease